MTLQIPITPEEEAALRRRSEAHGQDVVAFAAALLRREAHGRTRSFGEIAPDVEMRRGRER